MSGHIEVRRGYHMSWARRAYDTRRGKRSTKTISKSRPEATHNGGGYHGGGGEEREGVAHIAIVPARDPHVHRTLGAVG